MLCMKSSEIEHWGQRQFHSAFTVRLHSHLQNAFCILVKTSLSSCRSWKINDIYKLSKFSKFGGTINIWGKKNTQKQKKLILFNKNALMLYFQIKCKSRCSKCVKNNFQKAFWWKCIMQWLFLVLMRRIFLNEVLRPI